MLFRSSTAQAGTNLDNKAFADSIVAITGAAYDYAKPGYSTATLDFGNVRVGASPAAQTVAFTNAAVTDANYQEGLKVVATGAAGKFTASGFDSLAAGAGTANVTVSALTAAAGSLDGNVALALTSLAKAGSNLTDSNLTAGSLTVTGAVYDYANPAVSTASVAFGNVHVGDVLGAQTISVTNQIGRAHV